jgi:hypothetical protein
MGLLGMLAVQATGPTITARLMLRLMKSLVWGKDPAMNI